MITTDLITSDAAERLWSGLRDGLLVAEENLTLIIARKAWVPLGYSSFLEAWQDRCADIPLAGVMRPQVVYALFAEGASDEDIDDTVRGTGLATVRLLREQFDLGIPPERATVVRQFWRRAPSKSWISVQVSAERRARYVALSEAAGSSLDSEVDAALREHFGE